MLPWKKQATAQKPEPAQPAASGQADGGLRIRLLQSKMYEYDGTVQAKDRRNWYWRIMSTTYGPSYIKSLWLTMPFYLAWAYCAAMSQAHDYGMASIFHSHFIFQLALGNIASICCNLYLAMIFASVAMSGAQYPEAVYISSKGIAFSDRKRLIPWHKLQRVQTNRYLYKVFRHSDVIELYVDPKYYEKPLSLWEKLQEEWKTGGLKQSFQFVQPETNTTPKNPYESVCLRLPLELFGFEEDKQKFFKAIKEFAPEGAIPEDLVIGPEISDGQNYTALWLEELRSPLAINANRLLELGHTLNNGRYKITGVLGYGGFSVVYKAVPTDTASAAQSVAIKEVIINSGGSRVSKEAILRQIVAEIELLKTLDHPHIVKCIDYFIDKGRVYIVMQALQGRNLRDVISQDGALNQTDLIEVALQCCSILDYLHTLPKPLMHRDFTPDNLIWDGQTVKLIDFNVAEEANTNSSPTIVGKHCFLAPEQWCGTFTAAGDLYQLGCSLFFLATAQEPEPLSQSNPANLRQELDPAFCAIVQKLTEAEMENRYATASATAQALNLLESASK